MVQPGTNTYTGGTESNPTVNVSALTIDRLTVTGSTAAVISGLTTQGAVTIGSGTFAVNATSFTTSAPILTSSNTIPQFRRTTDSDTGLYLDGSNGALMYTESEIRQVWTNVNTGIGSTKADAITQGAFKLFVSGSAKVSGSIVATNLSASTISGNSISATTFYSGTTNLNSLLGEANTASNLESVGLFNSKVGTNLQFRGISAGTGMAVTQQTSAVTISYTGTATVSITQVEVDFGTTPVAEGQFTVADGNVISSSKIMATLAYDAPTSKDIDEIEMDNLNIRAGSATTGFFVMFITATDGSYLHDKFKINYLVG
jgi:hypothetical protein